MQPLLTELIKKHKDAQCSDPRDKVYALLSLAKDISSKDMAIVDYSRTVAEVYFQVLLHRQQSRNGPAWRTMSLGTQLLKGLVRSDAESGLSHLASPSTLATTSTTSRAHLLGVTGFHVGLITKVSAVSADMFQREGRREVTDFSTRKINLPSRDTPLLFTSYVVLLTGGLASLNVYP
jgi:hypothetical protein